MGCDIHGSVEKLIDGKWVMVDRLRDKARVRNYTRFAKLAGVRGEGPPARGLPTDISESTELHVNEWGGDGHSHSYLDIDAAANIFKETEFQPNDFVQKYPVSHFFDIDDETCPSCGRPVKNEYRIVFWFDN